MATPPVIEYAGSGRTTSRARVGSRVEIEVTVEAVRHRVAATVVKMPFFNPKRKTATPVV